MSNPVVHFEISGKSGAALSEFYGKLFEWPIQHEPSMNYWMVPAQGEGSIGGGIAQPDGEVPNNVTIYVQVDDLQTYLDRAEALGGTTAVPPTPIPGIGEFAMFIDPEGNCIGLFKGQMP
jgi:hypothetical protein